MLCFSSIMKPSDNPHRRLVRYIQDGISDRNNLALMLACIKDYYSTQPFFNQYQVQFHLLQSSAQPLIADIATLESQLSEYQHSSNMLILENLANQTLHDYYLVSGNLGEAYSLQNKLQQCETKTE